jgi:hypothetical protein
MNGRHRRSVFSATLIAGITLTTGCALAGVGLAQAQPVPTDPVVPVVPGLALVEVPAAAPAPAPPPVGAPPVPQIPSDQLLQPGQLGSIGDIMSNFTNPNDIMTNMFPDPAVPYTPVRDMPMGPPPPPDPAFAPPA